MALLVALSTVMAVQGPASAAIQVFPVPTPSAGLGRIVTAPNGDMWFVEKDAQKLARITPSGQIAETDPIGSGQYSQMVDLDIGPDGTIWALVDQGRWVMRYQPWIAGDGNTKYIQVSSSNYPYGKQIRVSASGVPWVTLRYDEIGIGYVASPSSASPQFVWPTNPPSCGSSLAVNVGTVWCQKYSPGQDLIKVGSGGTGGTPYPQADAGRGITSMSAGPVGSVWFTRHASGTMTTSPWLGSIGYLTEATGRTREWRTGDRTAPTSLVREGGTMWFTSIGAAKGIGHLDANGAGALTKVGNYRPTALTVGKDGAIWFTDATTNVIVRVTKDQLRTTNVDPGANSVFTRPGGPGTARQPAGRVKAPARPIRVRKKTLRVRIACPVATGCAGTAKALDRRGRALTKARGYQLRAGQTKVVALKVTKAGLKRLKTKPTKVKVTLVGADGKVSTTKVKARR